MTKILVWDFPTRVFHWLLALSFVGGYITGDSERWRDFHVMFGYTLLGLIVFRLIWGLFGSRYARFDSFKYNLGQVITYLKSLSKNEKAHYIGHNPAGSWAIYLLLTLGIVIGVSGVAINYDLGGDLLEEIHEGASNFMLAIVFIHIAGVLLSSYLHEENLPRSMLTGFKTGNSDSAIHHTHKLIGIGLLIVVVVYWISLIY